MNKRRRNNLHLILDDLEGLRDPMMNGEGALNILRKAQNQIERCAEEEEEALDNRPESFRWSADNDNMSENISDLSEASDDLEILIDKCQGIYVFDYGLIKEDIIRIVNTIKRTIHR